MEAPPAQDVLCTNRSRAVLFAKSNEDLLGHSIFIVNLAHESAPCYIAEILSNFMYKKQKSADINRIKKSLLVFCTFHRPTNFTCQARRPIPLPYNINFQI
jgi:hypothetical protein